jgi:hypothetical protein
VIKLRLNTGWNEYGFSRADGALLLNGHDIDIIPKMCCLFKLYEQEALILMDGGTDAPIIRFSHDNPVTVS